MFAAVVFEEKKKSLRGRLSPLRVKSERINLPNGSCFFIITAEKRGGKIPSDKIIRIAGRLKDSLIFPSELDLEGKDKLSLYEPCGLEERLLFRFAAESIPLTGIMPSECSVCVNDSSGIYIRDIEGLLPLAAKIQIVCPDKSLYEAEAERLFYGYGCSLILSEKFDSFSRQCDVIISYDGDEMLSFWGKYVFSKSIYCRVHIGLPAEYDALCPPGIDRKTFSSALYEKCNVPAESFLLDNCPSQDIY